MKLVEREVQRRINEEGLEFIEALKAMKERAKAELETL